MTYKASIDDLVPGDKAVYYKQEDIGRNERAWEVRVVRVTKTRVVVAAPFLRVSEVAFLKRTQSAVGQGQEYADMLYVGTRAENMLERGRKSMLRERLRRMLVDAETRYLKGIAT